MADFLIWSTRAREEYANLQDYLYSEWGEAIATRVIKEIDLTIIRIKNSPEQFPIFKKAKKIRRSVASPQTSIYFNLDRETIEIYRYLITGKILKKGNCKNLQSTHYPSFFNSRIISL